LKDSESFLYWLRPCTRKREIREVATKAPFIPFTLVTASGERYKVPTPDHISYFPETDEDGVLQAEEERAQCFTVFGKGSRQRLLFFDTITTIDLGSAPNPVAGQQAGSAPDGEGARPRAPRLDLRCRSK
jgi:hypothetical protein